MGTKICSKCAKELPVDSFYRTSGNKDGYRPACKKCMSDHYYVANRDQKLADAARHRELNREKNRGYARQYREANPDIVREVQKRHYAANSEREKAMSKEYRATHPDKISEQRHRRRARLALVECTLTSAQWEEVKRRYKQRCAYCGEKKDLTVDHVIPVSKGGAHSAENVVPACRSCNSSKQARNAPFYVQTMLIA